MSWTNPYTEHNRRSALAGVNREKVLRQKKEREFLRGITDKYELAHMDDVEARIEEEQSIKLLDIRMAQRQRSASPLDAPLPPAINTVGRFDAGLRCFCPTHGGATIWTGEDDGCIGIRNGTDGTLAYRIEKTEGLFVDALFQSSSNHMWVGLSDGTVRIYDPLVFILLYEAKRHTKAVTTFAETFDGKVFSGSVDGRLAKWDSEAHEFECVMEIPAPSDVVSSIRCITCYGYHLFVAHDSPVIRCLDAESGAETRVFEGHDGTVTAVAVAEGYLWSASSDATLGVWNINTGERLAVLSQHSTGVTSLMIDGIGHTAWSSDDSGLLCVWHTRPTHDFAFIRSYVPEGAGAAVRKIHGFVAVDASKMWSLGSNGTNFVWHSATNRVERHAKQAVLAMGHIIEQDVKELERWAAVLANLRDALARMKSEMASKLGGDAGEMLAKCHYFEWMRFALTRQWKRRWPHAATIFARASDLRVASRYFRVWARYRTIQHRRRHLQLAAEAGHRAAKNAAVVAFFRRAQNFYRTVRAKEVAMNRAAVLAAASRRRLMADAYGALLRYKDKRQQHVKRTQMADALAITVQRTLRAVAFASWVSLSVRRSRGRQAAARAVALAGSRARDLTSTYFHLWLQYKSKRQLEVRRARTAAIMGRRHGRASIAAVYWKWRRWTDERRTNAAAARLQAVRGEITAMEAKLDAVEHITGRQRLGTDVERLIDLAVARIEAKKARLAELKHENETIVAQTIENRAGQRELLTKNISDQVDDLIAALKSKLLNLHQDYAMIRKVIERCKNSSAAKLFLESHLAVKRIVVDLTGQSMLGVEDVWPLTKAKVRSIPKHHSEAVLTAIKTMIITFDVMSPEERESLQTDNEIAINAEWLGEFADVCIANRLKALGKASYRVKA